jgi:cytochrome c oxidase subunit II
MNILPQASTFATRADQLFLYVFLLSLVFLVFITGLMIYFVIRYSRKRHPTAAQIEGHTGLEITWTAIPLAMFIAIFYFGWINYDYTRQAPRDAMVVKVTGRQWSWSFKYPNGKQTNRLFAVIDRPLKVEVQSADVLHGFYIPAFRIKIDAVPGRVTTTWFQPTVLGSFDIECTVICGVDHSLMLSKVEVVGEKEFKTWYFGPEGTPEPKLSSALLFNTGETRRTDIPSNVVPENGAKTSISNDASSHLGNADASHAAALASLKKNACLNCHSLDGSPRTGPSFRGLFGKQETLKRGGKLDVVTMDEEQIALAITDPKRDIVQGFPPMSNTQIAPQEVALIVDYIKQLR